MPGKEIFREYSLKGQGSVRGLSGKNYLWTQQMQKLLHLRKEGPMHPQEDCKLVIRAEDRGLLLMVAVNSWLSARID